MAELKFIIVAMRRKALTPMDPQLVDNVDSNDACPSCGERNADWLIWRDNEEVVLCARCGTTSSPYE